MGNKKVRRVELRITVDIPEDHDDMTLVGYVVGGMRADRNLSHLRFIKWWVAEGAQPRETRYQNRLEMTMIALSHAVSRYDMSPRARNWLQAEMANIRKVLGPAEETR